MSSNQLRDRFLDAVLGSLWSQWTALGVAGTHASERSVVDPEALLLATAIFGRYDPRLFDEMLDWLAQFSDLLDVTRVRKMASRISPADPRVVSGTLDFMRRYSARWETSAQALIANEGQRPYGAIPLFLNSDGSGLPVFGEVDQFFAERGISRSPLDLRGMSHSPDLRKPATARLRLRALVGGGVRAEVLLYLATHDRAHGRLIATRSGFSQRQVSEYLSQLADSGFADRWDDGRMVQYRLSPDFAESVGHIAEYVDWATTWRAVAHLWSALQTTTSEASSYARGKSWRATLEQLKPSVPVEGLALPVPRPEAHSGEAILSYAEQYLERVAETLTGAGA